MNTCLSASPASLEMALRTCSQISLVVATRRKRVVKIEEMWEPLPFSRGFQMALLRFITMHRVRGLELKANHKLRAWWDICHLGCFKDGVKQCLAVFEIFFFFFKAFTCSKNIYLSQIHKRGKIRHEKKYNSIYSIESILDKNVTDWELSPI